MRRQVPVPAAHHVSLPVPGAQQAVPAVPPEQHWRGRHSDLPTLHQPRHRYVSRQRGWLVFCRLITFSILWDWRYL